jgi:xanthine dehydrogenase YagR molybdenum-binding subunit
MRDTHKLAQLVFHVVRHALERCDRVYARCAIDRLAIALKLDPVELRLLRYSDRDQNQDCSAARRSANATSGGVRLEQAQPRAALDARRQRSGRMGMATGVWEALWFRSPCASCFLAIAMPKSLQLPTSAPAPARSAQVAADMLGLPLDNITIKQRLDAATVAGRRWIMVAASVSNGATTASAVARICCVWQHRCRIRR